VSANLKHLKQSINEHLWRAIVPTGGEISGDEVMQEGDNLPMTVTPSLRPFLFQSEAEDGHQAIKPQGLF